jgi:hypothetical protein
MWQPCEVTPTSAAFVERLPGGIEAYADHRVKMSVVRAWIEDHNRRDLVAALPGALEPERFLDRPVSAWVTETEATIVYLTVRDVFFDSDDAYVEAAYRKNRNLLRGPLYRVLLRLFSAERVHRLGSRVFRTMHQGIDAVSGGEGNELSFTLTYPPHLVPLLIARCYATAMQAALDLSGWHGVSVDLTEFTVALARFELRRI